MPAAECGGDTLAADLATLIVAQSLEALDADAGFLATVSHDERTLEGTRVTAYSDEPVRLAFPLDAPYPLAEVVRTRRPLLIPSNEDLCDHPGLVRVKSEDHACATLPLIDADGQLLGALNLGFDEPHDFTEAQLDVIDILGRHCAEAMAVARRLRAEFRDRTPRVASSSERSRP